MWMRPGNCANACAGCHVGVGGADPEHHEGFIDWATYEMNQTRLAEHPAPAPSGRWRRA